MTLQHLHHLFVWMADGTFDPASANYDAIVDGKNWWLNVPGWTIRSFVYLVGWNVYDSYPENGLLQKILQDDGKTIQEKLQRIRSFLASSL